MIAVVYAKRNKILLLWIQSPHNGKRAQRQLVVFVPSHTVRWWCLQRVNVVKAWRLGKGHVRRVEGGEGRGSVAISSTRGEGRQERAVSGLVQVPPQCWDSGVSGWKVEKEETEWERHGGQTFKLSPQRRSSHSCGHFGTAVSVSPTGTWRWRSPQSLCPSRWGAEGRAPRPWRSPGGLRVTLGQRSHSASLLKKDDTA